MGVPRSGLRACRCWAAPPLSLTNCCYSPSIQELLEHHRVNYRADGSAAVSSSRQKPYDGKCPSAAGSTAWLPYRATVQLASCTVQPVDVDMRSNITLEGTSITCTRYVYVSFGAAFMRPQCCRQLSGTVSISSHCCSVPGSCCGSSGGCTARIAVGCAQSSA